MTGIRSARLRFTSPRQAGCVWAGYNFECIIRERHCRGHVLVGVKKNAGTPEQSDVL